MSAFSQNRQVDAIAYVLLLLARGLTQHYAYKVVMGAVMILAGLVLRVYRLPPAAKRQLE